MRIASVGEVTIDWYLKQSLTFVGGIGLNFAVQAKRSGAEQVSMVSCIGDDALGTWVLETLANEQIDTAHLAVLAGETARCDIEVTDDAERFFPAGGFHMNVLHQLRLTEPIQRFICRHDIAVTQYDGETADSLTTQLLQLPSDRVQRVIDFGDWSAGRQEPLSPATLDAIDLAFFSGDEATIKYLEPLAKTVNCLIVVTLGAGGSIALTTPEVHFQDALAVDNLVDTTGCGDAFQAAFTTNYFRDGDIPAALFQGANQAAQTLQHFGAFRQRPRASSYWE